jgi:predicted nuclease of predicted toxin-antitoxin system
VKLLLDACVSINALATVLDAGHDAIWAGHWQENPGDDEILARAARETRILVTLDKDFGELAVVRRLPHAGIVRLVGFRAPDHGTKIIAAVERYRSDLEHGAIITVEPGRVRVRPPE